MRSIRQVKVKIFVLMSIVVFTVQGCSSILNPYSSEFNCPKAENGKCISVENAYEESMLKVDRKDPAGVEARQKSGKKVSDNEFIEYQKEVYNKMAGLLRNPVTPVVAPPTVMRVLILPYKGSENELYMPRYVYMFTDGPRWIMGDYLKNDDGEKK